MYHSSTLPSSAHIKGGLSNSPLPPRGGGGDLLPSTIDDTMHIPEIIFGTHEEFASRNQDIKGQEIDAQSPSKIQKKKMDKRNKIKKKLANKRISDNFCLISFHEDWP